MSKFVMIIFGASGDLTKRKLMPALYSLYKDNRLPEGFAILGIGRTDYADETYRDYILNELEHFVTPAEVGMKEFCTHLHYLSMDPAIEEGYGTLDSRCRKSPVKRNRTIYCSISLRRPHFMASSLYI